MGRLLDDQAEQNNVETPDADTIMKVLPDTSVLLDERYAHYSMPMWPHDYTAAMPHPL